MYTIIYFKISNRTWTIHGEAYRSVACKIRTVFSPFRQHCLRFQQQEQEQDRSPSTVVVAVRDNTCPKPTQLGAQGTPGGPSPATGAAAPSCLGLLSVTQYRCNTGACILQGKEHQKFCSLKFSQFPFSKRVNKSSKTGIVSPFHSQACVSVFLSPKIKHKPKTNVPPTPNPRRPSSRDSS